MKRLSWCFGAILLAAGTASAQDCAPPEVLGQVVLPPAPCFEVSASYDAPTKRYPHGVLGDDEEYARLVVAKGRFSLRINLPPNRVFEDLAPRLADVDGQPGPEIVVVESFDRSGASLVVYSVDFPAGGNPSFKRVTGTPPIGQRFRWLAPVGIADFDGDGQKDIAYVETPHLGKTLKVVTLRDGKLELLADAPGFSNHRIGEDFISGGVRDCGSGVEAVVADADWTRIVAVRLVDGVLQSQDLGPFTGPESFQDVLSCQG